ncbi:MAG: Fic family protein, partial [Endomicrobium sp.]|nr:Fic family protein [Endomicrobium sp.]
MKIPEKPNFDWLEVLKKAINDSRISLKEVIDKNTAIGCAVQKGVNEYDYWDKVKYYIVPASIDNEILWALIKYKKLNMDIKQISLQDLTFVHINTGEIQRKLSVIDRHASKYAFSTEESNEYYVNSMMEEGIASSQLEGAAVTREIAKEMLRTNSRPKNIDEQMILNNYKAMEYIERNNSEKLSVEQIKRIHEIITKDTIDKPEKSGNFRDETDNLMVMDARDNTVLFNPPQAEKIPSLINALCGYANEDDKTDFTHPAIKAVILHFLFSYIHPFIDGNGRTARALFYWYMLRSGYKSVKYLTISKILKEKYAQYARAFLYTETDENDLTYFINFNLNAICEAIENFSIYVEKKKDELKQTEILVNMDRELNFRQASIIKE